jgi:hypothetical protein
VFFGKGLISGAVRDSEDYSRRRKKDEYRFDDRTQRKS